MEFNINKQNDIQITDRIKEVMTDFDIQLEHSNECFSGNIDIEGKDWNIGLIVGASGTGKSTIAKHLFPKEYVSGFDYNETSVLDNMPQNKSINEIEKAFTSVGFSSPPSWLKTYSVLSTGEKMRVDLARAILTDQDCIVFDEFTSVVDRTVAKTCSQAVQKAIREKGSRFIAVSCHSDIIDYLCPDWIYDTNKQCFFGLWGNMSPHDIQLTYTQLMDDISKTYGTYLGSITI